MATHDKFHSRLVFWLKILFPLLALVLLSTLFLLSRRAEQGKTMTDAARPDMIEMAQQLKLTTPEYSGVTDDGAAVSFRASSARPAADATDVATAQDVRATYEVPGGLVIDVTGDNGQIDQGADLATLIGNVVITTSSGYRLATPGLDSALNRTELRSRGTVKGEAPFGTIDAGGMTLDRNTGDDAGYRLVFTNGVKLIYLPAERLPE